VQLRRDRLRVDWRRVVKFVLTVVVSAFVGFWFQPSIADNSDAVNTVVTIFSILAGFLIAVITFIAESTLQQAKNWQELQLMKGTIQRQLFRQKVLFFLYLVTLGTALAMFLVPKENTQVLWWLQAVFLSLATFVFLASFALPGSLMKIQMERYEAALEGTKPQVIKDAKAVKENYSR
jgi:peptidoglycan/LPS O-acetylase OafA/YrhL